MAWCRQATSHYLSQCWPRSLSNMTSLGHNELTHWGLVMHVYICIMELYHQLGCWSITYSVPNHSPNQSHLVVNWTIRDQSEWNMNQNMKFSLKKLHPKISSTKCQPLCSGLKVRNLPHAIIIGSHNINTVVIPVNHMTATDYMVL